MILDIVPYGHPALRAAGHKVEKVDDRIRQLAADMIETMYANQLVGMAAQQVGSPLQMFVLGVLQDKKRPSQMWMEGKSIPFDHLMPLVVLNPQIKTAGEIISEGEGSPCFPKVYGKVERPEHVALRAYNLDNELIEFRASGLLARAVQHEYDHIQGVLFIDRMNAQTRQEWDPILEIIKNVNSLPC